MVKFIVTGAFIGLAGVSLSFMGNPANTGFCVSCFMENIAGSLGLHGNIRMQYIRPEIIGFVLGSFFISIYKKEFSATAGSSPLLKFFVDITVRDPGTFANSTVPIACLLEVFPTDPPTPMTSGRSRAKAICTHHFRYRSRSR